VWHPFARESLFQNVCHALYFIACISLLEFHCLLAFMLDDVTFGLLLLASI